MAAEQHAVEVIMARGFMSNMTTPAFLVDTRGTLVFFNDAAGLILGVRFEEAGPMEAAEWGARFKPRAADGESLAVSELPLSIALAEGRPAHSPLQIEAADGRTHQIEASAFPIVGRSGTTGAMAIFWERQA
jgi:PAS domain-containing protein